MLALLSNVQARSAVPVIYWSVSYESRRVGADMQYRFWWRLNIQSGGWYYNTIRLRLILNNAIVWEHNVKSSNASWSHEGTTGWYTVGNKTSGSVPFYSTVLDIQSSSGVNYSSPGFNLYVAPAYTTIDSFSVSKRDEHTLLVEYTTGHTIDHVWYSIDNGASWDDLQTDNIIYNLTAGTSYDCKIRVRRQDSQLTTDSNTDTESTWNYPFIQTYYDFKIGDPVQLLISNPLNRTGQIYMILQNGVSSPAVEFDSFIVVDFNDSEFIKKMYQSIPTSNSGEYKIRVVYGDYSDTTIDAGEYSTLGDNQEAPTFDTFEWKDSDQKASLLTGMNNVQNPTILIKNLSDVEFTIPVANKAISNYEAELSSYSFNWNGGASTSSQYKIDEVVKNKVRNGTDNKISVTVFDKRNQYTTKTIENLTIIEPVSSYGNITTTRRNGIEAVTYLNGSISYWIGDWANTNDRPNQLLSILLVVNNEMVADITQDILDNSIETIENNIKTLYINSDTVEISLNNNQNGFPVGQSFNVSLFINTGYSNDIKYEENYIIDSYLLSDGKIGLGKFKDSTGEYHYSINGMPSQNDTLLVHGTLNSTDEIKEKDKNVLISDNNSIKNLIMISQSEFNELLNQSKIEIDSIYNVINNGSITMYKGKTTNSVYKMSGGINSPDESVKFIETITKEELISLQNNNQLVPGTMYNIPDVDLTEADVYTDGLNTVVKYKDGRMEQYGLIQNGPKLVTADYWSFCNRTDVTTHIFVEPFTSVPVINTTIYSNILFGVQIQSAYNTSFNYIGLSPKGAASTQAYFSIFYEAKGRWY